MHLSPAGPNSGRPMRSPAPSQNIVPIPSGRRHGVPSPALALACVAALCLAAAAHAQTSRSPGRLASQTLDHIGFVQEPGDATVNRVIAPAVTVQLLDEANQPVAQAGVPVTLALAAGSGVLAGTLTRDTDASGLATFDDLALDAAGSKQLVATSGALPSATSASFVIHPAPTIATTSPLPGATAGVSYSQLLTVNDGTPPFAWTLTAGALPSGM